MAQADNQGQILGTTSIAITDHIGSGFEGSSETGCRTGGPISVYPVHRTAGKQEPTNFQPKGTEQLCPYREVQTRKFGPSKNNAKTKRLSHETGPEGCLLLCTNSRGTQEVPSVSIPRCDIRIPMFALRSLISTTSLHQTSQASDRHSEVIWHKSSDLLGRPTALSPRSDRATKNFQDCYHPSHRPWIYHQTREVLTLTNARNHLSGCPAELNRPDDCSSCGKTLPHTVGVQRNLTRRGCSMLELSALLGRMNQTARIGIWEAPLHYRALQRMFIAALHKKGHFTRSKMFQIPLTKEATSELKWWSSEKLNHINRMALNPPAIDMIVSTDASKKGWGASFLDQRTGGQWKKEESRAHINVLELKAAYLAIQAFVKETMRPRHIQVLMDNTTAVSYINKRGGTHSPTLASLALEIWNFCISRRIWITARHVPGVTNIEADFASRHFNNRTEWTVDKMVFQRITKRFYTPEVDLFASRINHQLPRYVARYPDPRSIATDAFLQHWGQWTVFIHAPIMFLPRVLQKIQQDQATGLVIAPTWPGQPWFPTLLELLVDVPAQLPITERTIFLPFEQQAIHPLWKTLRLTVWPLSGLVCKQQVFHQRCARFCWPLGGKALKGDKKDPSSCGLAGVCRGINVPFQLL